MSRRSGTLLSLGAALLTVNACVGETVSAPLPTQGEWDVARAQLEELHRSEPTKAFGATVQVTLREPHTGRSFKARGAIAVDPHRAFRMILVGPGGATAIDVWATPDRWRLEIPAANILRRGGIEDDAMLPIGFFRWWFLAPLKAKLLTSVAGPDGQRFVLRDGRATIDLTDTRHASGRSIQATRLDDGVTERVAFEGRSLAMAASDHATYDGDASGAHVEVTVEEPSSAPDPEAFADPDSVGHGAT